MSEVIPIKNTSVTSNTSNTNNESNNKNVMRHDRVTSVLIAVPLSLLVYYFTEILVNNAVEEYDYNGRIQNSFIVGFIVGLFYITLGLMTFSESGRMNNRPLQYTVYITGVLLLFNSTFVNWSFLSDSTKLFLLGIIIALTSACTFIY